MLELSRKHKRHVEFFHHRLDYLERELACHKGTPGSRDWMSREVSALLWVIQLIERGQLDVSE